MLKKNLAYYLIASLLIGCSADSDEDSTASSNSSISATAISGYLSNAEICIIPTGSSDCEVIGMTDENGNINLPGSFKSGVVKASIIAGQTSDSDSFGKVRFSYDLYAEYSEGTELVINPFTTLAHYDTTRSISDIASLLNIDEELIKGNYLESTEQDATIAHLIARSLIIKLDVNLGDIESQELIDYSESVANYINTDLINQDTDLESVFVYYYSSSDYAFTVKQVRSLEDHLDGTLNILSTNNSYFEDEGIRDITFSDGQLSLNNSPLESYTIDGDLLSFTSGSDKFLYASHRFGLQVPTSENHDLILTSNYPINLNSMIPWQEDEIVGKTLYFLNDDSYCSGYCSQDPDVEPTLNALTFTQTEFTMTEDGETITVPWKIQDELLILELTAAGNERDISFSRVLSDGAIILVQDYGTTRAPSFIFKEQSLAEHIYNEWLNIIN